MGKHSVTWSKGFLFFYLQSWYKDRAIPVHGGAVSAAIILPVLIRLIIPPGCEKPSVCVHNVTFSIRGFITLAWKRQIKDEQYFTLLFWKMVLCCIEYYVWYQSVSVVSTNTERGQCSITMRAHICIRCYYLIASHLGSDSRLWWKNLTRKDNATLTVTHQFTLSPLVISTVSRDTE